MLVRVRPNLPYLMLLLLGVIVIGLGLIETGVAGWLITIFGGLICGIFGYPVVASTLFRVPVVAIGADGIRLPFMGVRLAWPEVAAVRPGVNPRGSAHVPVLLIFPVDPAAVLRQVRPWLRQETRSNLARFGTPIVISGQSFDRSLDEIAAAVNRQLAAHRPPV
ncbi:hypothetical protein AB0J86_38540 [Micromonospora sp. NPDC049559]|uniref:hypothetical protein n=1 Tax=Micromonospora sp. NPDC049559 TaxID=3155923 RepID=UPI0034492B41